MSECILWGDSYSLLLLNFRGPAGGGERGRGCEVVPVILRSSICQGAFSSLSFILFMDKQMLGDCLLQFAFQCLVGNEFVFLVYLVT